MTEVPQAHQNYKEKSVKESKQTTLYKLQEKTQQHLFWWKEQFSIDCHSHCIEKVNDRCNDGNFSRKTRPNTEWDLIISRTNTFSKGENGDTHLESSRLDLKLRRNQTLQHSSKDPFNGHRAWTEQGMQLGFYTRACSKFQVRILRIVTTESNQIPRAMFLHLL